MVFWFHYILGGNIRSSVFWPLTLTVDELESLSAHAHYPNGKLSFIEPGRRKERGSPNLKTEIGVLKANSLTSSFALRQGVGKKWKLVLVMNSVSKPATKTQGRGLINGKERGERWLGHCFQTRAIYNSRASISGMLCTTCTSHPSSSAFQPWGFIKERLWWNALTRGENTVIDYDLLRWTHWSGDALLWVLSVYGASLINFAEIWHYYGKNLEPFHCVWSAN